MSIYLDDILSAIGEPDAEFPLTMRLEPILPQANDPDFSEPVVLDLAKLTDCDDVGTARLGEAADFLRKNESFRLAAICMYRGLFELRSNAYARFSAVDEKLGESIRMLIRLYSAREVKRWHEEKGIPAEISRNTLRYLRAEKSNFIGAFPNAKSYSWLRQLLYPELCYLHIVRFGFALAPRSWSSITFRHKNGTYLTFAKAGTFVDANGIPMTQEEYEKEGGSVTAFRVEKDHFYGNIITKNGRIASKPERVPVSGYEPYLREGEPVLNMHIPAGGGMTPDLVSESWSAAKRFYRKYLGKDCPKVISCGSWTCSPSIDEILPPEANLVKFVNRFYRIPNEACPTSKDLFIRPGTSLSAAIDTFISGGGRFRDGSMFLPLDEIE